MYALSHADSLHQLIDEPMLASCTSTLF